MESWIWPIVFLILGMGLAVLEVFFPSAGILGFLSASAVLAAIILPFWNDQPEVGLVILIVAIIGIPTLLVFALKYWPRTAMGRRILLGVRRSEDVLPERARTERLKSLVGQVGHAKCKMLPSGAITIGGRTVDAISEGMPIEPGQAVRVIEVRANHLIVRPTDQHESPPAAEDPLSKSYDDPFDESAS